MINVIQGNRGKSCCKAPDWKSGMIATAVLICLFSIMPLAHLSACAMSALIARDGHSLSDFASQGNAWQYWEYNDPWDYLGFVMANSRPGINSDGYGIVAYRNGYSNLPPENMWYKRVLENSDFNQVYYTGSYLDEGEQNAGSAADTFDYALKRIKSWDGHTSIVMCHARNATGATLGNHPFWFQYKGKTYTFMHNGNSNAARTFMITRINQMNPLFNWFILHPSNHFNNTNPTQWVDTEVFFSYIMCHIKANGGDTLAGLNSALISILPFIESGTNGVYNFIMSDGANLYAFRNSPLAGANSSYKLSYRNVRNQFWAIRTQTPQEGDVVLQPLELVVLSGTNSPEHYPEITRERLYSRRLNQPFAYSRFAPVPGNSGIVSSPNPFYGSTSLRIPVSAASRLVTTIYNTRGEAIWQSQNEISKPGTTNVIWDGTDKHGRKVSAGVYIIRSVAGNEMQKGRTVLLR
jgi:predicted glutamine amidotransferase